MLLTHLNLFDLLGRVLANFEGIQNEKGGA